MKRLFAGTPGSILLAVLIMAGACSGEKPPGLIGPLHWIRMGMPREEILRHLPLEGSKNTLTPGFIHISGITEPTYARDGLVSMIFTFRKEGNDLVLNAAHLTFDGNVVGETSLIDQLTSRYGKPAGRVWKLKGGYVIDILQGPGAQIKVTFDTPG